MKYLLILSLVANIGFISYWLQLKPIPVSRTQKQIEFEKYISCIDYVKYYLDDNKYLK